MSAKIAEMETEWLRIGLISRKESLFKKSQMIGWQITPNFPFYHYPSVIEVLTQLGMIRMEIERMLELSGAGALVNEYRNKWRNAESILNNYYNSCKTIDEVNRPFPEEISKQLDQIFHPELISDSMEEKKLPWKLKSPE